MRGAREHEVALVVDGTAIAGWTDYEIVNSILEPVDTFSLTVPATRRAADVWRTVRPDRPVKITVDGVVRLVGYVDEPDHGAAAGTIKISGRDKVGRLVQESAESVSFEGLTLKGLIERLAAPWFSTVTFSNARNRRVLRGRGKLARARDAVFVDSRVGRRIEPGQMRWAVIQELCEQAGYVVWSAGDGRELVVGQPDYAQEVQYQFRHVAEGSPRRGNVLDLAWKPSTADRYSKIVVLGAGAGTTANYGLPVAARAGEVKDNPATATGEGRDFSARKVLVLADREVRDRKLAETIARREMARRDLRRELLTVTVPRHGQLVAGGNLTLYAPDTLAYVEDEVIGARGVYLVVSTTLRASRDGGETTVLELVPKGTELVP